jgi:hypothetical protein
LYEHLFYSTWDMLRTERPVFVDVEYLLPNGKVNDITIRTKDQPLARVWRRSATALRSVPHAAKLFRMLCPEGRKTLPKDTDGRRRVLRSTRRPHHCSAGSHNDGSCTGAFRSKRRSPTVRRRLAAHPRHAIGGLDGGPRGDQGCPRRFPWPADRGIMPQ